MLSYLVSDLYIHPVKSLKSVSLSEAEIDEFGFVHDRRFMLVDASGKFISQRKHSRLGFLSAEFDGRNLVIQGKGLDAITFALSEFEVALEVDVWADRVGALAIADERTEKLSEYIGLMLSLVYMPRSTFRQVEREFFSADQKLSFADAFPFLLTNTASLDDLNDKLEQPIGMGRFRPNIVFTGDQPFQEDDWQRIAIGDVEFDVVKPCSRCVMTCIDEQGRKHKEPLKTLATYRRNDFGVCFGQNIVQRSSGSVMVGDVLRVLK